MKPVEALHIYARRYCMDQSRLWRERYATSGVDVNSVQAQTIYPRYQALDAILQEVERKVPADFASVDELLDWLVLSGQTAESFSTRLPPHQDGVARHAIDEERKQFVDALRSFVQRRDWNVVPMPSRRTLSEQESLVLWARLQDRWDVTGIDWYPLRDVRLSDPLVAYCAEALHAADMATTLRRVLAAHGVEKPWELRELRSEAEGEIDLALFDPFYNGSAGYWTSETMDWLIYASHENSITFAGDWLVAAVQAVWPDRVEHRWIVSGSKRESDK